MYTLLPSPATASLTTRAAGEGFQGVGAPEEASTAAANGRVWPPTWPKSPTMYTVRWSGDSPRSATLLSTLGFQPYGAGGGVQAGQVVAQHGTVVERGERAADEQPAAGEGQGVDGGAGRGPERRVDGAGGGVDTGQAD